MSEDNVPKIEKNSFLSKLFQAAQEPDSKERQKFIQSNNFTDADRNSLVDQGFTDREGFMRDDVAQAIVERLQRHIG